MNPTLNYINNNICVHAASTKFTYHVGQTYTYDYMMQTETSMDGAAEEKAMLAITGQADIEVIDPCEMVLKVRRLWMLG